MDIVIIKLAIIWSKFGHDLLQNLVIALPDLAFWDGLEEEGEDAVAHADPAQDQQRCLPGERGQQPDNDHDDC